MKDHANRTIEQARRLTGQPVCVVLHDGTYYIGHLKGMRNGQLLLAGKKGQGRMRSVPSRNGKGKGKAKVSGLFPALGSMLGGGAAGAATGAAAGAGGLFGGLGGFMGFLKQAMPMIQMGMGLVKQIMPIMSMFKK